MVLIADRFMIDAEGILAIEDVPHLPPTTKITTNVIGGLVIIVTRAQGEEIKKQWLAWHLLNDAADQGEEIIIDGLEKAQTKN